MIDPKTLPDGWALKPLRACVAPKQTWNPTRQPRKRIRYIELSGIDNQRSFIAEFSDLAADKAPSRAKKIVRDGDVIFATTRPGLKNIAVVPSELDNEICSTGFCVLRSLPDEATSGWLFALCRSDVVVSQVVKHDEKNAYPSVSDDQVLDAIVPIPPLKEQQRLVARIEALTHLLEQARHARHAALTEADTFLTIAQRTEYERLLEEEETTPLGAIGEVISGGTPAKSVAAYWGGEVPWVAPKEMKRFRIGESSMNVTQHAVDTGAAKIVRKPAALMVVRGMILAKRVPIAISTRPLAINQDMKAFIPKDFIDVSFLGHMLCGAAEELQTRVEIAGHGTCKLETSAWSTLPIPVPKLTSQRRIVERLDALAAKQTELRRLQKETEAELAAFTPALLAKAFRGEL
jgi:type I restriction enzyme S subunit